MLLYHLETVLSKSRAKSFTSYARGSYKALTMAFLILPLKEGGKSLKWEMLSSVCFLQYESAMEHMQKSKLSHYKKTMEVSKEVLCRFLNANGLWFETG